MNGKGIHGVDTMDDEDGGGRVTEGGMFYCRIGYVMCLDPDDRWFHSSPLYYSTVPQ